MKKLLFILLAWIPLLAVFSSCEDDLEEHELIVEKFGLGYDTTQVVFGRAVYDSVFNTMAIQIDTASLSYFNRAFIEPETGYLLRPFPDASFVIEEGQELKFKFRRLKISYRAVDGEEITVLFGDIDNKEIMVRDELNGPCCFEGTMTLDNVIGERVFETILPDSVGKQLVRLIVPDTVTFIPQGRKVSVLIAHNSRYSIITGEGIAKEVFRVKDNVYWRGIRFLRLLSQDNERSR